MNWSQEILKVTKGSRVSQKKEVCVNTDTGKFPTVTVAAAFYCVNMF